jgi:hypothetical protein
VFVALEDMVMDAVALAIVMLTGEEVASGVVPFGMNSANTCGFCTAVKVCLKVATPLASVIAVPRVVTTRDGELTRDWNLTVCPES